MPLETGTYISDLVATNPTNADFKNFGDDHLRLLKSVLKNSLPGISGAVTATHTELNYVDGVTSNIQTQIDDLSDFVANASFSAALPDQTGNAGKFIMTDGTNGSWSADIEATVMKWADGDKRIGFNLSSISSATTRTFTWPDSNGTVVCADTAQTLNNKTINVSDTSFTLQDDADSSKKARFQLSGISSGTTRVYTLPDLNTELVSQSAAQTLTNKTITVDDNKFLIVDSLDGSKQVEFFLNNLTTGNKRVITVPDKDITLGESAFVLLGEVTSAGAAQIDIEWTPGNYDYILVYANNIKTTNSTAVEFRVRFKIGGAYLTNGNYLTETPGGSDSLDTAIILGDSWNNNLQASSFKATIADSGSSTETHSVLFDNINTINHANSSAEALMQTRGWHTAAGALSGLRFYFSAGNISGTFRIFGMGS